jgi:hypothetical protein
MNPLKLSAQFAAYVWYTEVRQGARTHDESLRFARQNWPTFQGAAHEGWGKLLLRLAGPGREAGGRVCRRDEGRRPKAPAMAGAN